MDIQVLIEFIELLLLIAFIELLLMIFGLIILEYLEKLEDEKKKRTSKITKFIFYHNLI